MGNLFFTSDTHFGSPSIVKRERRPFKNIKHNDKYIIKTWNKQAKKNDIIYHLGDFVNCNSSDMHSWEKSILYVKKLKAKVVLLIGNNEERVIYNYFENDFEKFRNYCLEIGFFDVQPELYIKILEKDFYLNHYPKNHKDNCVNLFGHTHRSTGLWKSYGLNVGVDLNYFKLYTTNDIFKMLEIKEKWYEIDLENLA